MFKVNNKFKVANGVVVSLLLALNMQLPAGICKANSECSLLTYFQFLLILQIHSSQFISHRYFIFFVFELPSLKMFKICSYLFHIFNLVVLIKLVLIKKSNLYDTYYRYRVKFSSLMQFRPSTKSTFTKLKRGYFYFHKKRPCK